MTKHFSCSNSPFRSILFLAFLLTAFLVPASLALNSDGLSLLALKSAITADPTQLLATWYELDSTPCRWAGITCDPNTQRVATISLPNAGLTGYIPSELGALSSLSFLSLAFNNFSNPIPSHLFNASSLLYLDLSHNSFSGPLPHQITSLSKIRHLDLSSNLLNGSLPEELYTLPNLAGTLNLSYNRFSGEIPATYGLFPVVLSLDLRHNNLTGKVPPAGSLLNQGPTAFSGNPYLCGFPLEIPCPEQAAGNPSGWTEPANPRSPADFANERVDRGRARYGLVTGSLISVFLAVVGVALVSLWVYRKKQNWTEGKIGKETLGMPEKCRKEDSQKGKFVALDEGFWLELDDLLKASAFQVGNGRSGIVYKVVSGGRGKGSMVVGSGGDTVVAVRRLSEGDAVWRIKEFESEVEAIGRVQHPNIVRLRAYYYGSNEKLLVTDFISNGSLHNALHGGPGVSLQPLSWADRLKIAKGIARGLTHIHECSPKRYVHGNIKSSKILLDDDLMPYISGFGLTRLAPNSSRLTTSSSKKTTTANTKHETRFPATKLTQKSDVYSFGVVLLEILTGRVRDGGAEGDGKGVDEMVRVAFKEEKPLSEIIDRHLLPEVHCKKQVLATFHIALNCTEMDPELRPRMRTVADSLDRASLS